MNDLQTTDEAMGLDLEQAAQLVDDSLSAFERGVLVPTEAVEKICQSAGGFMRHSLATASEVNLLIEYARDAVATIAGADGVMDPVLVEYFDERMVGDQMVDVVRTRLGLLLESLELRCGSGDGLGMQDLEELCRTGFRSQRLLLSLVDAADQILQLAYRLGHSAALYAAAAPIHAHDGQVAHRTFRPDSFRTAMNLLAHLAADPDRGAAARSALLDLAGFVETAGEAVIRIPMHLLDDGDRQRLLGIHEARVELFTSDPIQIPLGLELLRDNRVVRGAVWQAFDAQHID